MSLYEKFRETKEEGFRDKFVRPLLSMLGFVGISNEHGVNEFGKDFVFSELDRFGRLRHMIVQAKHEEKINQGQKVDSLISQIGQAFRVPYTLPSTPTEVSYVSAVYVFNSGEITDNAKTQIIHSLPREFASNTHCFSGEQLEVLFVTTSYHSTQIIRDRLIALYQQLGLSCDILASLDSGIDPNSASLTLDVRGPMTHAAEQFLTEPILRHRISYDELSHFWQLSQMIRSITDKLYIGIMPLEFRTTHATLLKSLCRKAIDKARSVQAQISIIMNELSV